MSSKRICFVAFCAITGVIVSCIVFPCMAKEPRSAEDYFRRGMARYTSGDLDGAIEDFTNAIAVNSNIDIRAPHRVKNLKASLEKKVGPDSYDGPMVIDKFNALAYFNRGNLRMDKGDLKGAVSDFDKAITLNPQLGRAFNNRGYAKYRAGDTDGATRDYDRSVQLDAQNAYAYYNRGIFRHATQDFGGAIADFSRVIEMNPRLAIAFHDRGLAYVAQAKLGEAYKDFDRAIELDPGLSAAYRNRGLVLILLGKDAEAETDFAHYLRYAGDKKDELATLAQEAKKSRLAYKRE